MQPTIHLAFVDDWEVSGDGSGDPRELQFRPMRELVKIYNSHGIRGSFNAEMMQQLTFRRLQHQHPELKTLADDWDEHVCETFKQGHDIQLHVHPQWRDAQYEDGAWKLTADWSILNHDADSAFEMIAAGKEYLENLLRPIDPGYRCVSFRAGAWCIAPSPHMLKLLAKLGIVFDMSIVGGMHYDTRNIKLDYRNCEEDFLPYFPVMTDARKVSDKSEPIFCVPTHHFYSSRRMTLRHHVRKVAEKLKGRSRDRVSSGRSAATYGHEWAETSHASKIRRFYDKGVVPYLKGRHLVSDLAQLDYALLSEMLNSIRRSARASDVEEIPVILENHTKDVQDFSDIERFVKDVSQAADIKCVTLTEIADQLLHGKFKIRKSGTGGNARLN